MSFSIGQNPFDLCYTSNSASEELHILRAQCYILGRLSLLPLYQLHSKQIYEILTLYQKTLENIINHQLFPYRNFQALKELIAHIQQYCHILIIRNFQAKLQLYKEQTNSIEKKWDIQYYDQQMLMKMKEQRISQWDRVRVIFRLIQDRIPKQSQYDYLLEYVIVRRGLLEDPKYFIAERMAKKVSTGQLKKLLQIYENYENKEQLQQKQEVADNKPTFKQLKNQLRGISLALQEDSQLIKEIEQKMENLNVQQRIQLRTYMKDLQLISQKQKQSEVNTEKRQRQAKTNNKKIAKGQRKKKQKKSQKQQSSFQQIIEDIQQ